MKCSREPFLFDLQKRRWQTLRVQRDVSRENVSLSRSARPAARRADGLLSGGEERALGAAGQGWPGWGISRFGCGSRACAATGWAGRAGLKDAVRERWRRRDRGRTTGESGGRGALQHESTNWDRRVGGRQVGGFSRCQSRCEPSCCERSNAALQHVWHALA